VSKYVIRFTAENPEELDAGSTARLTEASQAMPGTRPVGPVRVDPVRRRIEAAFAIGGLVEMTVRLTDDVSTD